jgi:hypothetical protein
MCSAEILGLSYITLIDPFEAVGYALKLFAAYSRPVRTVHNFVLIGPYKKH